MLSLILPVQVAADAITVSSAPVITIRIKLFIRHLSFTHILRHTSPFFRLNIRTMHHDLTCSNWNAPKEFGFSFVSAAASPRAIACNRFLKSRLFIYFRVLPVQSYYGIPAASHTATYYGQVFPKCRLRRRSERPPTPKFTRPPYFQGQMRVSKSGKDPIGVHGK